MSPSHFLALDMSQKFLLRIELPQTESFFCSYKVMQRSINTHAYVNGAIKIEVDTDFNVSSQPNLVYGGISAELIHATR